MKYTLDKIVPDEYMAVADLWEASVRATHDFLTEEDILYFKPRMFNEYLGTVDLISCRDNQHKIIGFIGIEGKKIEMLFIDPNFRGAGIGSMLIKYALEHKSVNGVDVNEQNEQALGFYLKMGFKVKNRSKLDGFGKPYPVLSMEIKG